MINIPDNEYPNYYKHFLELIPETDSSIVKLLEEQSTITSAFINSLSEETAMSKYAEDKWRIKEVLGHLIDTERVLIDRAFRFSRKETQPLPSFDENSYISNGNWAYISIRGINELYESMRKFHVNTINNFTDEMHLNIGIANNTQVSVRAILYFALGHELHHLKIIRERYLKA